MGAFSIPRDNAKALVSCLRSAKMSFWKTEISWNKNLISLKSSLDCLKIPHLSSSVGRLSLLLKLRQTIRLQSSLQKTRLRVFSYLRIRLSQTSKVRLPISDRNCKPKMVKLKPQRHLISQSIASLTGSKLRACHSSS